MHMMCMTKLKEDNKVEYEDAVLESTDSTDTAVLAQKALNVLIQAVEFAQTKGVYSFEDSHHIFNALKVFRK